MNSSKSEFFAEKIEYLGYWITRQGIQPILNLVELNATPTITARKTKKHNKLRRKMWFYRHEKQGQI
jgi:hypothetical protein